MPGGWYQPPEHDEVARIKAGPAGESGVAGPGVVFGDDVLASNGFASWVTKTIGVIGRSWKGLLAVHALGAIAALTAMGVGFVGFAQGTDLEAAAEAGELNSVLPKIAVGLGVGLFAFVVITLATLAAGAYVVARDAVEGVGRMRLGPAFGRGLNSVLRILRGAVVFGVVAMIPSVLLLIILPSMGGALGGGALIAVMLLSVLPTVYLLTAATSLVGIATFEKGSVSRRSLQRIKGRFFAMFGRLLLLQVVLLVVTQLAGVGGGVVALLAQTNGVASLVPQLALPVLALTVFGTIQTAAGMVSYAELRARADGVLVTEQLRKETDVY